MSTCPECYEDYGCTCEEDKRIRELETKVKEFEAENKRLREALDELLYLAEVSDDSRSIQIIKQALKGGK